MGKLLRGLILRFKLVVFGLLGIVAGFPDSILSHEPNSGEFWADAPSIYVHVEAATWKPRGRFLYDIEGSILTKLALSGFKIVRNKHDAHQLTLVVIYREERGEQYYVDAFGTVIHGKFYLDSDSSWQLNIVESSTNSISGTPPYLDALRKFETNPYYFFLNEILRGHVQNNLDVLGGLIFALKRTMAFEKASTESPRQLDYANPQDVHTMHSSQVLYKPAAISRAIAECVDSQDRRVIPVLVELLSHSEPAVRSRAIEGLGSYGVLESRMQLLEMAQNDPHPHVRATAKTVANSLGPTDQPGLPQSLDLTR